MTTLFESMTSAATSSSAATPSLDLLEDSLNNTKGNNLADESKSEVGSRRAGEQKRTASDRTSSDAEDTDGLQRTNESRVVTQAITVQQHEDNFTANGENDSALHYQYTTDNSGAAANAFSVTDPHGQITPMRVVHVNVDQNQVNSNSAVSVAYSLGSSGGSGGGGGSNGGGPAAGVASSVFQPGNENAAVAVDGQGDGSRYTYYPAVQTSEGNAQSGPFYVMVSPQDMIPVSGAAVTPPRIIAPRSHTIGGLNDGGAFALDGSEQSIPVEFRKVESGRSSRDERRRATHNEVERRRRDKINTWITKLATVVPDCQLEQAKAGQVKRQDDTIKSKGGILSKTVDYILKLRQSNERFQDTLKDHENVMAENRVLRQQMEELRRENTLLHANFTNLQMQQQDQVAHGQDANMES